MTYLVILCKSDPGNMQVNSKSSDARVLAIQKGDFDTMKRYTLDLITAFGFVEKSVAALEPRFLTRALRTCATFRHELDVSLLNDALGHCHSMMLHTSDDSRLCALRRRAVAFSCRDRVTGIRRQR